MKLGEALQEESVLWRGIHNSDVDNGAIGVISRWIKNVLLFDSDAERPIQPVRIYRKHKGRCGEHGDMTTAACRTALIPARNIEAISSDHVWNEFYTGWRWAATEPVNTYIDDQWVYSDGWGKQFATVFEYTGFGSMEPLTDRYSHEIAYLNLNVEDISDRPVDGAQVMIASQEGDYIYYDCILFTNSRGKTHNLVGDGKRLYWRVDSDIGCNPEPGYVANLITNTMNGSHYTRTMSLPGEMPIHYWSGAPLPEVPVAYVTARIEPVGEFITYNGVFDELDATYHQWIDDAFGFAIFALDDEEYDNFVMANPFEALAMIERTDSGTFEVPVSSGRYWAVVSNLENLKNTLYGRFHVMLKDSASNIMADKTSNIKNVNIFPNPFNEVCCISVPAHTRVEIYDLRGRIVAEFDNAAIERDHNIYWKADEPSGIYFLKATFEDRIVSKIACLVK